MCFTWWTTVVPAPREPFGHTGVMTTFPPGDAELESSMLRRDIEAVRRYGEAHRDVYVEEFGERDPDLRLVVLMVGDDLSRYETQLRAVMEHPEVLLVRSTAFSRSRLDTIRHEVEGSLRRNPGAFLQLSTSRGRVNVQLAADQDALAHDLHARYEGAVSITLGRFPYPAPPAPDGQDEERSRAHGPGLPVLASDDFTVSLDREINVVTGANTNATLLVHNVGTDEAIIETNGGVSARIIDPRTGDVIGGFVGAQAMPLVTFRCAPGATVSIPLLVGTTSSDRRLGYTVPPGAWAIDVPITIAGRGRFRTPPLAIRVTDR